MTKRGGWSRKTLEMFGVTWPPKMHWKAQLVRDIASGRKDIPEQRSLFG